MAKVSSVAVHYGRKLNLEALGYPPYNSLDVECTMWVDLEEGDEPQDVIHRYQNMVRESVRGEFARVPKKEPSPNGHGKRLKG